VGYADEWKKGMQGGKRKMGELQTEQVLPEMVS
jgi:hypothetical protein